MEEQTEKKEKLAEEPGRNGETPPENRGSRTGGRTGSRYDPKNIRTGSRYDRDESGRSGAEHGKAARPGTARGEHGAPADGRAATLTGRRKEAGGDGGEGFAGFRTRLAMRDPMAVGMLVLIALLLAGYIAAAVFFAQRFYPGTMILGVNCTGKDAAWVKAQVQERVEGYSLTLKERYGVSETLSAASIGMHFVDDGVIEQRLAGQISFLWPLMMFVRRGSETDIRTAYEENRVRGALLELGCFREDNVTEPQDAYIEETDDGYVIVPEVMGTRLDEGRTEKAVREALDAEADEVILEFRECYVDPEVYADDEQLQKQAEAKNALLGADLTYDFGDRTERVDTRKLMEFVVPLGENGYTISEDAVRHYVNVLADTYDTYGRNRTFYTSIGTVESLYGGDYGWAMDREASADELLKAIREKRTGVIEPVYMYTAKDRSSNDIGSTYVEICIERQEMWCYLNGELIVDTPVVTGNPSRGNATPAGGVWAIDAKMRDYTLVGEGYRSPVDFWMPFNGNIGIHDMQTRYYFGSTIYLTHGSHGCINTPLDAVEQIYNAVEIGTPVIVYQSGG